MARITPDGALCRLCQHPSSIMGSSTAAMPASPARALFGRRSPGVAPEASPFGSAVQPRRWISAKGAAFAWPESIAKWKRARARAASPRRHRRSYSRPSSTAARGQHLDGPNGGGARRLRHSRRPLGRRGEQPRPGLRCRPCGRGLHRRNHDGRDPPALLRHSEVIGYDVFVVPAMLLEAWVAERRNEPGAAEDAYRRALELAG